MTKRIISALLALSLIIGTLLLAASCSDINIVINDNNGGSTVQPDSSTGEDDGAGDSTSPIFIENGNGDTDYSNILPSTRGILSTVRIVAHFERYIGYGQTSLSKYNKNSSGVIYRLDREAGDAYIITNFHAIYLKDAVSTNHVSPDIEVYLYGQEDECYSIPATYVGGSLTSEIAILRITDSEVLKHSHALAATIADSNEIRAFDDVFAVGNPEGLGLSITDGKISIEHDAVSVTAADGKTTLNLRVIRTSAPINEGNSGGGLFNDKGELIGIVVAKKTGDDIENIAYAIPVNLARLTTDILIESSNGLASVGFTKYQLGITMKAKASGIRIDEGSGAIIKEEIVSIESFLDGSALEGMAQIGDEIRSITVDGKTTAVTRIHNVIEAMLEARLDSTVTITLVRGDDTVTKTVTVTEAMATIVA